jgi:hypothetical protein
MIQFLRRRSEFGLLSVSKSDRSMSCYAVTWLRTLAVDNILRIIRLWIYGHMILHLDRDL